MKNPKIPLVDLERQYHKIRHQINSAIFSVLEDSSFILGPHVAEFEDKFASYIGVKHCVAVSSGTDALLLAYMALGIGKGDEVITVANTFFATTEPLYLLGAKPVFVDVNPDTYLIDPSKIVQKITKKTKAIVPVHLYGQIADMRTIKKIAKKYKLKIIEDSAQAHGATYAGHYAGTFGDVGVYSFYPGKNLGAYGDAGCLVTNDDFLATFFRKMRDHGRISKYEHDVSGLSARMDGIQGAILSVKLKYLSEWVRKRRNIAKVYDKLLPPGIKKPVETGGNQHAYHLYVIETENRDSLLKFLNDNGIGAGIHYPVPLHKQKVYKNTSSGRVYLPVTEKSAKNILSLPIFPEMTLGEVKKVSSFVRQFLARRS